MILEVLGLGILIPTISLILEPETINSIKTIPLINYIFQFFPEDIFIFIFLAIVALVYILKTIFLVYLTFKKNRFLQNITAYISNRLYSNYLSQEYHFYLNRNSSELIKNIQIEVGLLSTYITSLISILIEFGFVLAIIFTLLYIEFLGALSVGIFFGLLSLIFFHFTKKKIKVWGEIRQDVDTKISKIILESLGGIKDILILGKTQNYIKDFSQKNLRKYRIASNQETLTQISRYYLELISVLGVISFIAILIVISKANSDLISVLGVFLAAAFRLLPSLNRILNSIQTIKYSKPSLDVIYNEVLNSIPHKKQFLKRSDFKFEKEIKLTDVSFGFNKKQQIFNAINLKIKKGQVVGIIGESGSGKSTLIDLIMGLHHPTKGEIRIDGILDFQKNQAWKNIIGYVSQSIYLTDDTIKNNIALGIPNDEISENKIFELLKEVQLEEFVKKLELGINTKVGERGVQLSGGQIQRLGIARALYNSPEILILDEATSALDSKIEKEVMECIYKLKQNKTIIMIAHRLNTLKKCDFLYEVKSN